MRRKCNEYSNLKIAPELASWTWLYIRTRDSQLILKYHGKERAVITPPDRYQVKDLDLDFNDWVEFNKCIRNIRHYLASND